MCLSSPHAELLGLQLPFVGLADQQVEVGLDPRKSPPYTAAEELE